MLVGSEKLQMKVLIDTSRTDSALNMKNAFGQTWPESPYLSELSSTSERVRDPNTGFVATKSMVYGETLLQGYEMKDDLCVEEGCFSQMSFLGVEDIEPEMSFSAQGFLGFGPNADLPESASVSFHANESGDLAVWFDEHIPEEGLSYFFNLGEHTWVLPLTNLKFDAQDIQPEHMVGLDPLRVAAIDAASKNIKLGRAQFELLASTIVDTNDEMNLK